jgi:hypothetical protein
MHPIPVAALDGQQPNSIWMLSFRRERARAIRLRLGGTASFRFVQRHQQE